MHFDLLNHHIYEDNLSLPAGASFKSQLCSHEFCSRLHSSFLNSQKDFIQVYGNDSSEHWDRMIVGNKRSDILNLMLAKKYNKALRYTLSNPIRHNLWYGFDNIARRFSADVLNVDSYRIYDVLRRFYEAMGGHTHQEEKRRPKAYIDIDSILRDIEAALRITLTFPAPYAKMMGLVDRRGIIRERALWGLYLAWRANQNRAKTILELGGGLGYAAFYSSIFGTASYTIVDLPLTLVASGHFLALTKGEENINLYGTLGNEQDISSTSQKFNLLPPHAFPVGSKFDIVVNMDSFPEFGKDIAQEYVNKIKTVTQKFLSINHEGESYTVRELFINDPDLINYSRFPFWLRKGYVEEMFEFR